MNKFINIWRLSAFMVCMLLTLSSCLEAGLDELESYDDAEITGFKFEHRWEQAMNGGNNTQLGVVSLPTDVKIEGNTISCTITVPEAGNPSFFTEEIRNSVKLEKIVGIATISTASTIYPLDGAPVLGKWGDFSKACKYKVVAADGRTTKEWVIQCTLKK
ncbi:MULTISPECIES: DUF5018-related domain-containing protein [Bacteroides]|uniref:DUF5018-related domain-containing protein n=1 Tax=Bacteroides TaxID=816 RepID=UPI000AB3CAA6|nr:hypothetical protein [Bacteroides congonensis]